MRRAMAGQLALFGGAKAVTRQHAPWPLIDAGVIRAVTQALKTQSLSPLARPGFSTRMKLSSFRWVT